MRVTRIMRHHGCSFEGGSNILHFWVKDYDASTFLFRWNELIVKSGLAGKPAVENSSDNVSHVMATVSHALPADLVKRLVEAKATKTLRDLDGDLMISVNR